MTTGLRYSSELGSPKIHVNVGLWFRFASPKRGRLLLLRAHFRMKNSEPRCERRGAALPGSSSCRKVGRVPAPRSEPDAIRDGVSRRASDKGDGPSPPQPKGQVHYRVVARPSTAPAKVDLRGRKVILKRALRRRRTDWNHAHCPFDPPQAVHR